MTSAFDKVNECVDVLQKLLPSLTLGQQEHFRHLLNGIIQWEECYYPGCTKDVMVLQGCTAKGCVYHKCRDERCYDVANDHSVYCDIHNIVNDDCDSS